MTIDRLEVVIEGSGPYGFRLAGGDGRPLSVTKLRRQSKACAAGLHEGDILLGINGFECRTMSHSSAMALLEDEVDRLSLSVFRGALDDLPSAFNAAAATLRPLSPGSLPPPRRLPPPPAAALRSSGDLVIDQPSFLRQKWPQQKLASPSLPTSDLCPPVQKQPPPPPPPMPSTSFPPIAEPRIFDSCPAQPLPAPGTPLPTFRVRPFSTEAKPWTPHQQAPVSSPPAPQHQPPAPSSGGQPFHVSHHVADSSFPTKWQPTETPIVVRSHTEINVEPEPQTVEIASWPTPSLGHATLRLDHVEGQRNDVEMVPRWALPLRSEYDWREFYFLGDHDDWEVTEDGQYLIRKKKIFADSSFYDDPEHKYPTIEEQIKMARKVAQSLTSPGNVKARGQRMFLRRKEKADHWVAEPRQALRRAAAARAAATVADHSFLESEPYYNPTPWSSTPWAQAGGGAPSNPSWTPKTTDRSIDRSPSSGSKWQPARHVHATPSMPKHSGNVAPQVAFKLAKDLTRANDKGSRMFAKLRARAAAEEVEGYMSEPVQSTRGDVMKRIADSYVPPSRSPRPASKHDVVDNSADQPGSATRLIEMIERSRATTGDPFSKHPATGGRDTTHTVSFTTTKTQAGFRPVRFKAPIVVTAADFAVAQQGKTEGISDF